MASSRLYGKVLATLRGSVSNRLLMYCAYVHCSYCLALVFCVALLAVLCVPPMSAGRAIRCLAGRHPSLSTPFLPTAGPLLGPARLSLVTIMLPLSNLIHGSAHSGTIVFVRATWSGRAVMSVCKILFVDLLVFRFGFFAGMCDVNSCKVFLPLFMALSPRRFSGGQC